MLIDTKKIPTLIKKLRELERLSSDPDMLPLLASIRVENDASPPAPQRRRASGKQHAKGPKKGDLKKGVSAAINGVSGRFTAPSIVEIMKRGGVAFAAQNPHIAVNGVLRKMVEKGSLKLAMKGSGRTPNQYERIGKGSGD